MDSVYFWAPTVCMELDVEICEEIAKECFQQNVNKMYRLKEYSTLTSELMVIASQLSELNMQKRVGVNRT